MSQNATNATFLSTFIVKQFKYLMYFSSLLLLVEPSSGAILKISMGGLFDSMLEMTQRLTGIKGGGKSNKNLFYRMKTDFAASHNELLFYTPKGNIIELIRYGVNDS